MAIPTFLRPEVLPFTSIEIVRATADFRPLPLVCSWCPTFDKTDPANLHASHGICPACIARVEAAERAAFHRLLVDPTTSARLDAMLADNARIDAAAAATVVVELEIVPPSPDAPRGPVVDVVLEPKQSGGAQ